ncbi:MAG: hypothetical protein HND51_20810 [Chloroflexi bacterium]|nr:hypothetical protein [Chloroflexota bacterium]
MKASHLSLLALLLFACGLFAPKPEIAWNNDPENVVLELSNCCGFVPYETAINALPDAIIYGDGRFIWVEINDARQRVVMEAQLREEEMAALLQKMVDAGFYGWKDQYADYNVTDLPNQCMRLRLSEENKSVCEYAEGAPAAFHRLYGELASGAGMAGKPYVPEEAYVTSLAMDFEVPPEDAIPWSVEDLGISLAHAAGGIWMEGTALEKAWEVVNSTAWIGGEADENGDYYRLLVQVPGLSLSEP